MRYYGHENGAKVYDLRYHDPGLKLSQSFRLSEFACRDGTPIVLVHPALVALLQAIRNHFDRPVRINSAFRTPYYNQGIGGRPASRHILGMAADIDIPRIHPREVANWAENSKVGGLGRYRTFTHVDVWGKNRRWDKTTPIIETP